MQFNPNGSWDNKIGEHSWNRAYGALFSLRKEQYSASDIQEIEDATDSILEKFREEGRVIISGGNPQHEVKRVKIHFSLVHNTNVVDMDTIQIQLLT